MYLHDTDQHAIHAQLRRLETRTGVQIVTAVVGKSDSYAELPWKAFALGAALAGLAIVTAAVARPQWVSAHSVLVSVTTLLGVGASLALLAVLAPPFARLFLTDTRRETEVRQQAQSLFLTHEVFRTADRTGVLALVSVFERSVEVVADTGLQARVTADDWARITDRMTSALRQGGPARALVEGLGAMEDLFVARGFAQGGERNELPDQTIQERGV